jgi:hypothetical protein
MKKQRREAALFFISSCEKYYMHKNVNGPFFGIFLEMNGQHHFHLFKPTRLAPPWFK